MRSHLVALVVVLTWPTRGTAAPAFDRKAWLADFELVERSLEQSYSHLAWFGSPESGIDLPALHHQALESFKLARSDAEASTALIAFVQGFHDGHLVLKPWSPPASSPTAEPPKETRFPNARTACAAWGYAPVTKVAFSLPFESLPGFALDEEGLTEAFRSGTVTQGGVRFGVIRIPRFRASEFPSVCVRTWSDLAARDAGTSSEDVSRQVDRVWLETLATRLRRFSAQKVDAVVVDLGGNGGGNDLGDWAVREFSSRPVHSAPLLVVKGDAGVGYLNEEVSQLRKALTVPDLADASRIAVAQSLARFEQRSAELPSPACPMNWVWTERRPWKASPCTRLIDADFFSGPYAHVDAGTFDPRVAKTLWWATITEGVQGAWAGQTFVLTNDGTGSSAEAFTSLMHDGANAKVVGTRTMGAGCGFMSDVEPVVLKQARFTLTMPNCVRLRPDGTDDVAGVTPDLPVLPTPGESPRARAVRVLDTLARELKRP